ncbi:cupredoxin domain-containing protein [Myxococcus stipitatus]|uniref:cupredoxin domain-containing protein n=1 Tax=Myxococcus stipitatus TaxID=83455 RepID=UPI0031450B54
MLDTTEVMVVASSLVAAAGTGLFFFGPRQRTRAKSEAGGTQQVDLMVDGGYRPDRIVVRAGMPVKLNVLRTDRSACSEQFVLGDLGVSRTLPTGRVVSIDLPALKEGAYDFTCGMNMLRGRLIAES